MSQGRILHDNVPFSCAKTTRGTQVIDSAATACTNVAICHKLSADCFALAVTQAARIEYLK